MAAAWPSLSVGLRLSLGTEIKDRGVFREHLRHTARTAAFYIVVECDTGDQPTGEWPRRTCVSSASQSLLCCLPPALALGEAHGDAVVRGLSPRDLYRDPQPLLCERLRTGTVPG